MIVKGDDTEANLLDRCLKSLKGNVDGFFITITQPNKKVEYVCKKYGAIVSHFKWVNDFSAARNFNFSQVTSDYEFIGWTDADDVVKGAENIKKAIKMMDEGKIDCGVMDYLYDFDEYGRCTVKHLKTRIIRKGCVEWAGKLHEDFRELRSIEARKIEDVQILHLTDEKRAIQSAKRNIEIALEEEALNPDDPRSTWLVANALMGEGKKDAAKDKYLEFIKKSGSDEEKYLAYLNVAEITQDESFCGQAIILRPSYPNAYHKASEILYKRNKKERAIEFIEIGLQMPVPENDIIVYNPMDYDYNPLMLLMRIHFEMGHVKKSMLILDTLLKSYPKDKNLIKKKKIVEAELGEMLKVDSEIERLEKIEDKEKLRKELDKLPQELKEHPKVCYFRNINFIKETSSGKDLAYYCSYTDKVWNPEVAEKDGVGGSEEAVINLSKQLAKKGWNVTVYNNCGREKTYDGVHYKQFWQWNPRDKQDVTILWRHPRPVDHEINSEKIYLDLHDVLPVGEFTEERVSKIDKIFVKTNAHRVLFPHVPDDKFAIIPNGLDISLFEPEVKRNKYLILNTSSADRHLETTLDVFEELTRRQPDKPWKLAWYYGWGVYDDVHKDNKEMLEYKERCIRRFDKLVKEGRAEGGTMIGHKDIAKKYLEAGIFLYPSQFYEIHCYRKGTKILTDSGEKNIEELCLNDNVVTHLGNIKPITMLMTKNHRKIVTVDVYCGDSFTCSPEHPLYVEREGEKKWINAGELVKKDLLLTPRNIQIEEISHIVPIFGWRENNLPTSINELKESYKINSTIGWFLGYFAGDGHAHPYSGQVSVLVSDKWADKTMPKVLKAIESFGIEAKIYEKKGCVQVTINSHPLARWFRRTFYEDGKKVIPMGFVNNESILEGLLEADGSFDGYVHTFTNTSSSLIGFVKAALSKHRGIACKAHRRIHSSGKDSYFMSWTETGKTLFYESDEDYIKRKVKRVSSDDTNEILYNMEVADDNSYIANGYATHNCISAAKAQAAGCKCITSDFAALDETIKYGTKIHTSGNRWGKENTFGDSENREKYVEEILKTSEVNHEQISWAKKTFNWDKISSTWNDILTDRI